MTSTIASRLIAPDTPRQAVTQDGGLLDVPEQMTLAEFEAFPWREGDRWELIYGVPVMSPSGRNMHDNLIARCCGFLDSSLAKAEPPRIVMASHDVRIDAADSYLEPDVMVVREDDDYDPNAVPYTGVPELVVEILSPSTAGRDLGPKQRAYAAKGIPEYWVADPDMASLKIQTLRGDSYEAQRPDDDGFAFSPLLNVRVKLSRKGKSFAITSQPAG